MEEIPVAKGRSRFRRVGKFVSTYTPKKTKDFEELVAEAAKQAMGDVGPLETPLRMFITFVMPIPASYSKKRRLACSSGEESHTKKPDIDNLCKSLFDGMNGIVYKDDAQIVSLNAVKCYGLTACITVGFQEHLL